MAQRTNRGAPTNGVSEIQTLTFAGTPTGGTVKLRFRGQTTAPISWSSTNNTLRDNIDTALEALSSIGTGNVTTAVGTMTLGIGTITVTFTGDLAKLSVPNIAVALNSLTGTAPTLAVAETTPGVTATRRNAAQEDYLLDTVNGTMYANTGVPPVAQWTEATPKLSVTVQLTNAQVKALRATPQTLVAAPGANQAILVHEVYFVVSAAGGAYTETDDNLAVEYATGADIIAVETTTLWDQASVSNLTYRPDYTTAPFHLVANSAVQLFNSGDGELGGGHSANTVSVRVFYSIVPTVAFSS